MFPVFSGGILRGPARATIARSSSLLGTYELADLPQENIVEPLTTLESTFGRSGGMLTEVLGTSLRGSE